MTGRSPPYHRSGSHALRVGRPIRFRNMGSEAQWNRYGNLPITGQLLLAPPYMARVASVTRGHASQRFNTGLLRSLSAWSPGSRLESVLDRMLRFVAGTGGGLDSSMTS